MPLRDHSHAPLDDQIAWDSFHGLWPSVIALDLSRRLPDRYVAAPHVHLGSIEGKCGIDADDYAVRIFEGRLQGPPVAAVEIVSPSNKDRTEHRRAFVAKCAGLLQNGVCVTIIDLVTNRSADLYGESLDFFGRDDPAPTDGPSPLRAVTCRWRRDDGSWRLAAWDGLLAIGRPLPTLPLWLAEDHAVPLELEASYEDTCRALRIA
jgi:hypothetical protein